MAIKGYNNIGGKNNVCKYSLYSSSQCKTSVWAFTANCEKYVYKYKATKLLYLLSNAKVKNKTKTTLS